MILCVKGQVNLSVFPAQINKDEYATLKIIIENTSDVQQVLPPPFKKFIVVSGPNHETSMTSVNGHLKKYAALVFMIKPTHTGKIKIEPAIVLIGGKKYTTNSTELFVKNALSANSSGPGLGKKPFPFLILLKRRNHHLSIMIIFFAAERMLPIK